jgi:hypothetical protein
MMAVSGEVDARGRGCAEDREMAGEIEAHGAGRLA